MSKFHLDRIFTNESDDESDFEVPSNVDMTALEYPNDLSDRFSSFTTDEIWEEIRRREINNVGDEKGSQVVSNACDVTIVEPSTSKTAAKALVELSERVFESSPSTDIYEVEKVCGRKTKNGKTYYLIKWSGFSSEHNTWEPSDNILGVDAHEMANAWK